MKSKSFAFIAILLMLFSDASAQWDSLTPDWCLNMVESGDYMFFTTNTRNETFIRVDLKDTSFQTMKTMAKPNGIAFNGISDGLGKQLAVLDKHILYSVENNIFISHNYGDSWDTAAVPPMKDKYSARSYCVSQDNKFLLSINNQVYISQDSGYTFKRIFLDPNNTWDNVVPTGVIDSILFFNAENGNNQYRFGLHSIRWNDTVVTNYGFGQINYYPAVKVYDRNIICAIDSEIYVSSNKGETWHKSMNVITPFIKGLGVYKNFYTAFNDSSVYLSADMMESFAPIGPLMSYVQQPGILNTFFYDGDLYVSGTGGIYRLKNPELVLRQLTGQVYFDKNANGKKDADEVGIGHHQIRMKGFNGYFQTDSNGYYDARFFYGADTAIVQLKSKFHLATPKYYFFNSFRDTQDFGIQMDPTKRDVGIRMISSNRASIFRPITVSIQTKNLGVYDEDVEVQLKMNEHLEIDTCNYAYKLENGVIYFNFNLKAFDVKTIFLACTLADNHTFEIGDSLFWKTSISINDKELNDTNNHDSIVQVLVSSYDPNDKSVTPKGSISPVFIENHETLNYLIRFQNTGTDTAFNVLILDTLDDLIDLTSFEITESSHMVTTEIVDNRIIHFKFNNIFLPDSGANYIASNGFIAYSVKAKSSVNVGDRISNTAHIYFDKNLPIVTNTVETNCVQESSVIESINHKSASFNLYPNPTNSLVFVNQTNCTIQVFDFMGRLLNPTIERKTDGTEIDLGDLTDGQYVVKVTYQSGISETRRIVKCSN